MNDENIDDLLSENTVSSERENAIIFIKVLQQWFIDHYNICPMFYIGTIKDALDSAFELTVIKDRRPVLVYIHHNNKIIMDYLQENYIVWAWDITNESNRNVLIKIWKENFPNESFIHFSMDQCPMLIGIMQRSPRENDPFPESKYEYKELLKGDSLMHTPRQLNLETLFDQLVAFKEEFDENEQYLSFNFVEKTGLCWEMILKIAEYLSLNDLITTFSFRILPLLPMKLPIVQPTSEFMRTMIQKINYERIISLHIKADNLISIMEYPSAFILSNIIILILDNLQDVNQINEVKTFFSNLTCLSLRYEGKVSFHRLGKIVNQIQIPIKRLEIYCTSIACSHNRTKLLFIRNNNSIVETFVLNVTYTSLSLVNNCAQHYPQCVLRTITDFIKIMPNIRSVYLIINKGNVETLLDIDEWMGLAKTCNKLEKITLKVITNMSNDTELVQKIQEIENSLHIVRESIKFEVKVK